MGPIRAEAEIDVSRERAFDALGEMAIRPSFTDHFLTDFHLTRIESSGVGAGARFRLEAPLRSVWMDTAIVELDRPFRIVEEGRGGRANRIPVHTVWELTEGPGPMTVVRLSQWTEPNKLDRGLELLSGTSHWAERGWKRAMRRLRDGLEGETIGAERIAIAGGNRYATGIP